MDMNTFVMAGGVAIVFFPALFLLFLLFLFIVCLFVCLFCVLNFKQRTEMLFHPKRGHSKSIVQLLMDMIWKHLRVESVSMRIFNFPWCY